MQKIFWILTLMVGVLLTPVYGESFNSVTSVELIEGGKALDGTEVLMEVEVIGDVMIRGEHAWVNGLDKTGAMGLWMSAKQAKELKVLGNSKFKGDTIKVSGTFHRACLEHGGDMDVHVKELSVVKPGSSTEKPIPESKIAAAALLTLAMAVSAAWYNSYRRRSV